MFAAGALAGEAQAEPTAPRKPATSPFHARGEETFTSQSVVKGVRRVVAEPVLQCPAPDSMGVAWAVNGLANGAVEFADNPQLQNATIVRCGGFGVTSFDDQALQGQKVTSYALRSDTRSGWARRRRATSILSSRRARACPRASA